MGIWKRWTTGICSRVDWMVRQVENHEAMVSSSIGHMQAAAGRANAHLGRVRGDAARLRIKLAEAQTAAQKWRDRAQKLANRDQATALACLRRHKASQSRAANLAKRVEEHEVIETQIKEDLATVDEKIGALKEKRNLMRTRQARAEAMGAVHKAESLRGDDMDEVFERWEFRLCENEYAFRNRPEADLLEKEFEVQEEQEALLAELKLLQDETGEPVHGEQHHE